MSRLRRLQGHALDTGGFLSFSLLADGGALLILGYFAAHTVQRSTELLTSQSTSVAAWLPVVLGGVVLLVLIPLVGGRLWSQISTRYTSEGVSQWRFMSYRALAWPDIVRIYYDRRGLVLEGRLNAIRIHAGFYRHPDQMLGVVHAQLAGADVPPIRQYVANVCRPGASELPRAGARAGTA